MRAEAAGGPSLGTRSLEVTATLPNFIVIGAMKAGTTSLFHYLEAHPDVYMSPLKELDFFVESGNWKRGARWYAKQFRDAGPAAAIGEASTAYSKYPTVTGVPERMARLVPNAKLIYLLRDPIARMVSHYRHRVSIGAERKAFDDAIRDDPVYIRFSRYAMQLDQFLPFFDREQILLITSEDLKSSRAETMQQVYSFVGVDHTWSSDVLEKDFYESSGRAAYPPAIWWARRKLKHLVPASKKMKEFFDTTLPQHIKPLARARAAAVPGFDRARRAELAEIFSDDVARLRSWMPPDWDAWGIAQQTVLRP